MSAGDELKLKHTCAGPQNKAWQGVGIVIKLDEASEEVFICPSYVVFRTSYAIKISSASGRSQALYRGALKRLSCPTLTDILALQVALEFRKGAKPPTDTTVGFSVEYVWKSTTFDRMQNSLKLFAVDETSVSGYLYHRQAVVPTMQAVL
jgi:hypothetical protein